MNINPDEPPTPTTGVYRRGLVIMLLVLIAVGAAAAWIILAAW